MKLLLNRLGLRRNAWGPVPLMLFAAFTEHIATAAAPGVQALGSPRALAFAEYIMSHGERDPLAKAGPVGVLIEASLPDLYKSATLLAVRTPSGNGPGDLHIVQIAGDGTVAEEVIDRVFTLREQIDRLPVTSLEITPANYKFRFAGEVKTGGAPAYIYDITPKKKGPGAVTGKFWMDAATGHEVMVSGQMTDASMPGGKLSVVRDTQLLNGVAYVRVTHVNFVVPQVGRAEVAVTEVVLSGAGLIPQSE